MRRARGPAQRCSIRLVRTSPGDSFVDPIRGVFAMKRVIPLVVALVALSSPKLTAPAYATDVHENVRSVFDEAIPNSPGKALLAVEVEYPPGAKSPSHYHEKSAFIMAYVL